MLVIGLLVLALGALASAHKHPIHIICVPETAVDACYKMVEQAQSVGVQMKCLPARDRVDCVYKVKDHEADFEVLEPEDMYLGLQLSDESFTIFEEIRTKEEPKAEFRYEGVAVIPKDLKINSIKELRGLKSCHTGVGRNVGYKIPITKLTKMGILDPLNDTTLSPRENELKALSTFFSKGCLVGTWSPHPETNARLKKTYSNLCELCEHPETCDYPDKNSGYEGALRCLAKAGGEVAWTKVIYVKKFFGMPYGSQPAHESEYNPEGYSYLCPDGTRKPVTGPPCIWAARPWPGFMASTHIDDQDIKDLRDEIAKLNDLGETTHADWIAKVLTLNNKTLPVANTPHSPLKYLEKAKYKDVIERDVLDPRRHVRICVISDIELEKCELLKDAAYSRDIRPSLSCVRSHNCFEAISKKEAEVVVLEPHEAVLAERINLKPLLNEQYDDHRDEVAIATVKKGSSITSVQDFKGKKACVMPSNNAGLYAVVKYLLKNNVITKTLCPLDKTLTDFFSNIIQSDDPIKCIDEGNGDIAFVPASVLQHYAERSADFVCFHAGKPDSDNKDCDYVTMPPRMVMASKDLSDVQKDEVRQSLLSAANLYGSHPDLFRLFGDFNGKPNVLFSNGATGLIATPDHLPSYEEYKKMIAEFTCST
uniref:Transferrin n=1 Tax=Riptortus pedestris TaxID=329032 RepID=R4WJB4_RIPPE|nr:transferrin [Riptortus pedestris]